MSEHLCLVCPVLYPAAPVRFYERPQCCRAVPRPVVDALRRCLAMIDPPATPEKP